MARRAPAAPAGPLRVALFGGDERVRELEALSDGRLLVSGHPATPTEARRLAAALRQRRFSHLVLLTNWTSHSKYQAVKQAARGNAKVLHWPRGLGALRAGLRELVGLNPSLENPSPPLREQEPPRMTDPTASPSPPPPEPVVTTAPGAVPASPVLPKQPAGEPFVCTEALVCEVLALDPARSWLVSEIAALLRAGTRPNRARVHGVVTSLLAQGTLRIAEPGDGTRRSPRRVMLSVSARESSAGEPPAAHVTRRTVPKRPRPTESLRPSSPPALPPAPLTGRIFVVLAPWGGLLTATADKCEAADALLAAPGARLFREVATRLRVDIED